MYIKLLHKLYIYIYIQIICGLQQVSAGYASPFILEAQGAMAHIFSNETYQCNTGIKKCALHCTQVLKES